MRDHNGQQLAYAISRMSLGPAISGQAAHQRRGAADCGEYREAAGAIALNVIVGTGSNTRGECNMPKCELARRSQLAQARRPEYQTSEYLRGFQRSHSRYCPWHQPARQ